MKESKAIKFCKKLVEDDEENTYAKSYAEKAIEMKMSGEQLKVQLRYIGSNIEKEENKESLRDILEIDENKGYMDGYCQICGDREDSNAFREEDSSASGLVCKGCHEEFGDPDICSECGKETYEGVFMNNGNFFCKKHS